MNPRTAHRFVAYYRVITDRQGRSGLGLEAQQKAVTDYLNGGAWELVGEFVEIESGKKADRPELARALEACRKHKARLVIAKLDRLSRNLAFVATLMDSGVEFVAVDIHMRISSPFTSWRRSPNTSGRPFRSGPRRRWRPLRHAERACLADHSRGQSGWAYQLQCDC